MVPNHIAIIMDGNGRWAKKQNLPRSNGHKAGTQTARDTVTRCRELGVKHLTLYTFSKENWSRPKEEISQLFELLTVFLTKEMDSLKKQDIRLKVLGELADFPFAVRQVLNHAIKKTQHCKSMTLNLALNYSGRDEIVRACKKIVESGVNAEEITEKMISDNLYTHGQPDPDLIIRSSGEIRLSNYLLYQAAYSEFYFTDVLWPDFNSDELDKALETYSKRQRRFGKTTEQIKNPL